MEILIYPSIGLFIMALATIRPELFREGFHGEYPKKINNYEIIALMLMAMTLWPLLVYKTLSRIGK